MTTPQTYNLSDWLDSIVNATENYKVVINAIQPIDLQEAYQSYAKVLGHSVQSLTKEEKQQAFLLSILKEQDDTS